MSASHLFPIGQQCSGTEKLHIPRLALLIFLAAGLTPAVSTAANIPGLAPSLKTIAVPYPEGLLNGDQPIVVDADKAIALGKALFWDMAVGSDGVACATCHFHAGADSRTKNQFSPGKAHLPANPTSANAYDPIDERGPNLANYQLKKGDFPLYKFGDPANDLPIGIDFVTLQNPMTYNVVSSAGTFSGQFKRIKARGVEECTPLTGMALDQTFNVGGVHTRRVEPRNTPTIVNAVLFDRNFWDGRANHVFNGVSPFGERDPDAVVWEFGADRKLVSKQMRLDNSSLASQAVAPLTNEFEMSCRGRTIQDIARKLLGRRALQDQAVSPTDGALGAYRHRSGKGLRHTYLGMIKQSFAKRYWAAGRKPPFGKPSYAKAPFAQAEANFPLFFGLAVQMYASTLISDDSPFDRADLVVAPPLQAGENIKITSVVTDRKHAMTDRQLAGLRVFVKGLCNECHTGPVFSSATNRNTKNRQTQQITFRPMLSRQKKFFEGAISLIDVGYFNNAAVPSTADPGLTGVDGRGQALAFAEQYLQGLAGNVDNVYETLPLTQACAFQRPFTTDFVSAADLIADPAGDANCANSADAYVPKPETVAAALSDPEDTLFRHGGNVFKVPQLYNVELTGPYMHNGGMATLEQAIDNYSRGGNFGPFNPNFDIRNKEKAGAVVQLRFSTDERAALADFLKSLTDDRVRFERAPFDHPQLFVANGHPGDHLTTDASATQLGQAVDDVMEIPAVGAAGRSTPLPTFDELLPAD